MWDKSDNNRKAKFYSLTTKGKRQLQFEAFSWNRMADVIGGILNTAKEELRIFSALCSNAAESNPKWTPSFASTSTALPMT